MGNYVEPQMLREAATADEASSTAIWETLAAAVSRLFDRQCEVPDDFFAVAPTAPGLTTKTVRAKGTEFVRLFPYIAGSITAITIDGTAVTLGDASYFEQDGYLIFASPVTANAIVSVTARYGFGWISAEIIQACIEQALYMWRKKDLAFTEISGVSNLIINREFTPTFDAVTKRYRDLYSQHTHFA